MLKGQIPICAALQLVKPSILTKSQETPLCLHGATQGLGHLTSSTTLEDVHDVQHSY